MEHERLDILAARFWEGECTEAEEQELKELVNEGAIPQEHAELKAYLDFTESAQAEDVLGGAFEANIMQEIERRESNSNGYPMWMKIAAGIVILLGLFSVVRTMTETPDEPVPTELVMLEDTYEDPEMAYEEVKKALALLGMKMNDGMDHAGSLGLFDQAKEEICSDKGHVRKSKN